MFAHLYGMGPWDMERLTVDQLRTFILWAEDSQKER